MTHNGAAIGVKIASRFAEEQHRGTVQAPLELMLKGITSRRALLAAHLPR